MKKATKIMSLLVASTIFTSSLYGCVKKTEDSDTNNKENSTAVEEAAKPGNLKLPLVSKPITLKIWSGYDNDTAKVAKSLADTEFYKELENRTGVHVEFTHPAIGQEKEALNIMLASGEYPDIIGFNLTSCKYPGGYEKAISDGVILDVKDSIKKYAPNYLALLNSNPEYKRQAYTDNGKLPGFYSIQASLQLPYAGTVIRQDWLDDLGLKTPETYDDWYNMLKAFKSQKNAEAPFMLDYQGISFNFAAGYGLPIYATSPFFQVDGKVKYGPAEPGYKEYLTMINKWYSEGLIDKDFSTRKSPIAPDTYSTTGKAGAWTDIYLYLAVNKMKATANTDTKYRAVAVPPPVKNKGDKRYLQALSGGSYMGDFFTITKNCKEVETAIKWLDYNYSPDGVALSNYGIEGKTFTKDTNGKPKFTELITKNPDGLTMPQAIKKYVKLGPAMEYHWERESVNLPQDVAEAGGIWSKDADFSRTLPLITLTDDEGAEYAKIMGDINTYVSEMTIKFILGVESLSKYDDFTKRIKSMNIDKAINLQQAALDRYNARK